ncbi:MAG TPA: TonB-dependent receptor [Vicinamibacteria bacterium]|nr:TonB-dependent receptor [Vicinamibacteria bacterium]
MLRSLYSRLPYALLALAVAAGAHAQSQATTGVIQGTVEDASGAAVPGALVEAKNVDTNLMRSQTSSGEGRFVFLQLAPGRYTVTVTLTGFATLVQESVTLTVGQTVTLSPKLKVSSVAETVTVTGTATVDTSKTESSSTLNETTISTTPVLGRKFEDLLTLTPGVAITQGPDGDEINFAGQRGIFNNVSLDGGDYNNGFFGEQVGGQRANIDITLDAIQEFQVVAAGANAEFGRTAGGVVNVITKSGGNELHGSLFHFQRLEGLTSEASDGTKLEGFHREQFGGTIGGPIKKDKAFFFLAAEHINGDFERPNLSRQLGGTPCPVQSPTVQQNEGLIGGNPDCQRLALLNFFQTNFNQNEGLPVSHPIRSTAVLGKLTWQMNENHNLNVSYNWTDSKNENQTFDVDTYGTSANGTEGDPTRIHVVNANLFSTLSGSLLNEFHFTYSRENRPRAASSSNFAADVGMGFDPSFRFGNPFFLQPNIDEVFWRTHLKDNLSLVSGNHNIKVGAEWIHSLNDQVFRGFFTGRYLFDSVNGFLRYASPAGPGGFGPSTVACSNGTYVTHPSPCPAGSSPTGGPLLFFLQVAGSGKPGVPAPGASTIDNEEFGIFVQDSWKVKPNVTLNYGLRWDAQLMAETVDPQTTAYASLIGTPGFPSDGTIPDQWDMIQPRFGFNWDVNNDARTVLRGNVGLYNPRQNMLTQVGSTTDNGLQQQSSFAQTGLLTAFGVPLPTFPNTVTIPPLPDGVFPLFTGIRVFDKEYKNPRIFTWNVTLERELAQDWSGYVDFTWAKGERLTRFFNINLVAGAPFGPQFGDVFVTTSVGESKYRGGTLGLRKRFSNKYQLEANYTLSKDEDDDSNERDPFTDYSATHDPSRSHVDFSLSNRDVTHRFNLFGYGELGPIHANLRVQSRSAQPITPGTGAPGSQILTPGGEYETNRNSVRKDNEYFSVDVRLMWPLKFGANQRYALIPIVEVFNLTNADNQVNPLSGAALFDFSGFLRKGVGDPRQMQLAIKFEF